MVTEYLYHKRDDFIIEVELFCEYELEKQFVHLVDAYRRWHFHLEGMDAADREYWTDQANLARDTFNAMFRGKTANIKALLQRPDQSQQGIVKTLLSWARELGPSINDHEVKSSLKDCSELLFRLTSDEKAPQGPAAWPYIKKIRLVLNTAHVSCPEDLLTVSASGFKHISSATV